MLHWIRLLRIFKRSFLRWFNMIKILWAKCLNFSSNPFKASILYSNNKSLKIRKNLNNPGSLTKKNQRNFSANRSTRALKDKRNKINIVMNWTMSLKKSIKRLKCKRSMILWDNGILKHLRLCIFWRTVFQRKKDHGFRRFVSFILG